MSDAYIPGHLLKRRAHPAHLTFRALNFPGRVARGNGYLSGSFPAGVTSLDGVPTPADIKIVLRNPGRKDAEVVVAVTRSEPDGTWKVEGLNPNHRYDVICRMPGFNDLILSNVSPVPY